MYYVRFELRKVLKNILNRFNLTGRLYEKQNSYPRVIYYNTDYQVNSINVNLEMLLQKSKELHNKLICRYSNGNPDYLK